MTIITPRYTEEMVNDTVYENEDRILESIREYIVDNIEFENVGDPEFDTDSFYEKSDIRILFNLETEEIYEYRLGVLIKDERAEDLIKSGKVVSVYDFSLNYLDGFIENELILKDEENRALKDRYNNKEITKEEYIEEIEILIYERYIEEYMNSVILTIEYLNRI